jgi:hypothetical protein
MSSKFDENGKFIKQYNTYDLSGQYGIGWTLKGEAFYFDLEDYNLIKDFCWFTDPRGYIRANVYKDNGDRTSILMHQIIMKTDGHYTMPDHIHGKDSRNDNRKSNLRVVTKSQNNINQPLRKDNTSGVKGVNWNSDANKWRVRIQVNKKRILIGDYNTLDEARKAREEASKIYHKEYDDNFSQKYISIDTQQND